MGTWISHLRIAENLLGYFPDVDEVAFTYGNLAPDSGLPNADWTVFDPPKEVTHYLFHGEGEDSIHDHLFFQQYLAPVITFPITPAYSFRLGYFFHLICDSIWAKKIGIPTVQAYEHEIQMDSGKAWDDIKADWYDLDQVFVHTHPECLFWRVLAVTANPPSQLPYISDNAFHQQMDHIRKFYRFPEPEWLVPRTYPYLNENKMNQIVADSTEIILHIWDKIGAVIDMGTMETTLSLVPEDFLLPYEIPLGDKRE